MKPLPAISAVQMGFGKILDALASPGSLWESESAILVFEIRHVFGVCLEYVQRVFRVCSECVQSVFYVEVIT